jgi:hypothetical protein
MLSRQKPGRNVKDGPDKQKPCSRLTSGLAVSDLISNYYKTVEVKSIAHAYLFDITFNVCYEPDSSWLAHRRNVRQCDQVFFDFSNGILPS